MLKSTTLPLDSMNAWQNIARKARDPWLNAELTRDTKDKDYGVNVFIVLLLHFQAVAREGRAPSLRDGLVVRVRTDSPFANSVGPYSEFLLGTLELIHTAVNDRPDFCKVRGQQGVYLL